MRTTKKSTETLQIKLIMKYLLFIFLLFAVNQLFAQDSKIKKEKWHWNHSKQDTVAGYAQVLKVDNILYISGAVTTELSPEGINAVYKNLAASLASYGATFENVVKENLFTTDMETMKKYNYAKKKFYAGDFPAATWIQVERLYMPDAKLEVELIAHLPK
ncbi:Enamine deaminase RidA, house cleaning of reactive enamine intermediates, YjgF/YER057c/UK114 family [Pedobacter terrae]|uniref:Enamine deaminase RidA, house cleaning of reactive enamine intermediates, YjgF/YER057c/UK114 family n=2 Tax=Pedobacter terrae TaxID=405671 RepID=A0A1G7PY34_9SPHI|nr:Enamine deaminase RidA, house cleaning of reactive enamine intermediates, YjgF/YER057c/UK114 family [Pedobacter terrae]